MSKTVAVQYLGPFDRVVLPVLGVEVDRDGDPIKVTAETAESMLADEASWAPADQAAEDLLAAIKAAAEAAALAAAEELAAAQALTDDTTDPKGA